MDIFKYTDFFHDGALLDIEHQGKTIVLSMQSAEIALEELPGHIALSSDDRITGKLHLEGIKNIYINREKLSTALKMHYDNGKIFDLEIKNNEVLLSISWRNYPPKARTNDFSTITINAESVYWENIPDLET
jgi:hypothetical protein